ncbi:hypothetical protein CEG14_15605 [Bordetella genomosp. 1]|uniref:Uncharacterized protein n=1 Tax=Bordetella genomosp. 1 TaxID=1395607 RepID=A0A261SHK3_9BORD|nr:hypothetical protein [Bordetella genomosp. 1]MDQ8033234.1 hypothetical protein [Bordetella sp.]OZI36422.1 hypothetical protein CEG14_15605 [Bordetella genomosp. 1]OZI57878.1 hypothetical protein CAL27_20995 [Bordetella genomosp. 1]
MHELRRWEWQDPIKVLMSRETASARRTCEGCSHVRTVVSPFGDTVVRCLKGRPYGKKCGRYEVL